MNQAFQDIYQTVWKEIFPGASPFSEEKFLKLYGGDLNLLVMKKCEVSGVDLFTGIEYGYKRLISQEEVAKRTELDNFLEKKEKLGSFDEVLKKIGKIAQFRGSRSLNSEMIESCDDIYSSSFIYNSTHIYSSQKLMYCFNDKTCEYLLASKGNADCSFGIRLLDSGSVSNSFDVHWCGKSANIYFCHDSYDLRDCMFCFHLISKRFCIANMQFEEEEYKKLKEIILAEYFQQLDKPKPFITLADL